MPTRLSPHRPGPGPHGISALLLVALTLPAAAQPHTCPPDDYRVAVSNTGAPNCAPIGPPCHCDFEQMQVANATPSSDRTCGQAHDGPPPTYSAAHCEGTGADPNSWCMVVNGTSADNGGVFRSHRFTTIPASLCPVPRDGTRHVKHDRCPAGSVCCFSSQRGCAAMAMAYNERASPNVSETCQFYTANATNNSFATCATSCSAGTLHLNFQYPLRLPGKAGTATSTLFRAISRVSRI